MTDVDVARIRGAWLGRASGCQLGKPVETLSGSKGLAGLRRYLEAVGAWPLRDYIPYDEAAADGTWMYVASCKDHLERCELDDDINYSVLALMMLERHGRDLTTIDVARTWLFTLPPAVTFSAERAAYGVLVERTPDAFAFGVDPGFDLAACSDNEYNDWIGATIRADVYGWVCPGRPDLAARLVRADAELTHRGDGVHCPVFVAALGAAIPSASSFGEAIDVALGEVPSDSGAAEAVAFGRSLVGGDDAVDRLHERFGHLHPVHSLNNLALCVWALLHGEDDYSVAVGEAVAGGWDTDCNGATVGGLWGLSGREIPAHWTEPWRGRVVVRLAGVDELDVEDLVARTVAVAEAL